MFPSLPIWSSGKKGGLEVEDFIHYVSVYLSELLFGKDMLLHLGRKILSCSSQTKTKAKVLIRRKYYKRQIFGKQVLIA